MLRRSASRASAATLSAGSCLITQSPHVPAGRDRPSSRRLLSRLHLRHPFKLVFDGPPPPHWCITAPSLVLLAHQEHSIHTSEASTGPSKVTEPDDQDR